jgi:hypothetical protein
MEKVSTVEWSSNGFRWRGLLKNNYERVRTNLMQLINDVEFMEDFIKVSAIDKKIDTQTANEILRLIQEIK